MEVDKKFVCSVSGCGKRYNRPAKLMDHMRSSHTGERPFACPEPGCDKKFARNKELSVHKLSHLPAMEKPFQCHVCGKGLNTKQHLVRHLRTHIEEPVSCELCGQRFVKPGFLQRHLSLHRKCPECGILMGSEAQLKRHIVKQHCQRYHCGQCSDLTFDSYEELQNHIRDRHPRPVKPQSVKVAPSIALLTGQKYALRPLPCPVPSCDRRFIRDYDLRRHISSIHGSASAE